MESPDERVPHANHRGSVLARFGVAELLERLGVIGHVGALARLIGGVNLVTPALDLDLAHLEAVGLKLRFEGRLRLPLRLRGARALTFGESRADGGDCDNG